MDGVEVDTIAALSTPPGRGAIALVRVSGPAAIGVLEPHLAAGGEQRRGRIVIGTVTGDLHDIGKNLVVTMMRGVGFEVVDLGVNVPREAFCDAVAERRPDFLGLSALLTTTMMEMREVIRERHLDTLGPSLATALRWESARTDSSWSRSVASSRGRDSTRCWTSCAA